MSTKVFTDETLAKRAHSDKENEINNQDKDAHAESGNESGNESVNNPPSSDKTFLWILGIILGVVLLFIIFVFVSKHLDARNIKTIDELHQDVLEGKFSEDGFIYRDSGFSFVKSAGLWFFQWQKGNNLYDVSLRFSPLEVESVPISGVINSSFNQDNIYITFDPLRDNQTYNALAAAELSLNLARALGAKSIPACTVQDDYSCINRSILSCENRSFAVIYLNEGSDFGITLDNNCITIGGVGMDMLKSVDRLLYQWYGVIE